MKIDHFKTFD